LSKSADQCCPPRILIAEDSEFNMMTICTILKEIQPVEIVEAQNGEIAV
jgi:CheY-like chemotaxis protein